MKKNKDELSHTMRVVLAGQTHKQTAAMTISRQRCAQIRNVENGKCMICSTPSKTILCDDCNAKSRDRQRKLYRIRNGIPVDAPISNRGRPRTRK